MLSEHLPNVVYLKKTYKEKLLQRYHIICKLI